MPRAYILAIVVNVMVLCDMAWCGDVRGRYHFSEHVAGRLSKELL